MMRTFRSATAAALAALALLGLAEQAGAGQPERRVRILADHALPVERSAPVDVRWASDRSVFLLRFLDGISEIEIGDSLQKTRQPVPPPNVLKIGRIVSYSWGSTRCTESAAGDIRICYDYQYY